MEKNHIKMIIINGCKNEHVHAHAYMHKHMQMHTSIQTDAHTGACTQALARTHAKTTTPTYAPIAASAWRHASVQISGKCHRKRLIESLPKMDSIAKCLKAYLGIGIKVLNNTKKTREKKKKLSELRAN